jgi:hypothetical protein
MPARDHGNAYALNFADAHSEIHKLKDKATINWQVPAAPPPPSTTPARTDTSWPAGQYNVSTGAPEPAGFNPDWSDLVNMASCPAPAARAR